MTEDQVFGPERGFGLYVHWPYCARICPYCDFNVYAAKDRDKQPLVHALLEDMDGHSQRFDTHPALTSVFFGGGTPSLLNPSELGALVDRARVRFGLTGDGSVGKGVEITLEANPNDVLKGDIAGWAAIGVNRLSLGVQSFDDQALAFLGRDHGAEDARRALDLALKHFRSVSIDLIYARPGHSLDAWRAELELALGLGVHHLSLYELTIEAATPFGKRVSRGDLAPLPDDAQAELYELTQTVCEAAGFPAYEVSNHACGVEHRSRHNLTYWRSGDWIGIGPGAHGRLTLDGTRYETIAARRPQDYVSAVQSTGVGWSEHTPLSLSDLAVEVLTMGLRSDEGVRIAAIEDLLGHAVDRIKLDEFQSQGLATLDTGLLALSLSGRLLADRIVAELLGAA
ncbi:MAG: radical SAM family heme chaperone HemW [Pseudomonadota bacterium]